MQATQIQNKFSFETMQSNFETVSSQQKQPTQQNFFSHQVPLQTLQPQPHAMSLPSVTPWIPNAATMPWTVANTVQPGGVMQFRAHLSNIDEAQRRAQLHQKRKSDLAVPPFPHKQFISEEKITAHFNGLHISSNYIQHTNSNNPTSQDGGGGDTPTTSGKCFTNLTYHDYQVTAKELEEKLRNASRISVCDEIRKYHDEQKKVSFIPETLLNRIEKPCTALVLWQPPPTFQWLHKRSEVHAANDSMASIELSSEMANRMASNVKSDDEYVDLDLDDDDDDEYTDPDPDIDDFVDNNNTCTVDFNNIKTDGMDEDL